MEFAHRKKYYENKNAIGVIWYQKHLHKEKIAFIGEFIVKEDYRHCAYGKETRKKIEEDARKRGYCKIEFNVFKQNYVAHSLYLKCGYKLVENYDNDVIMEKIL